MRRRKERLRHPLATFEEGLTQAKLAEAAEKQLSADATSAGSVLSLPSRTTGNTDELSLSDRVNRSTIDQRSNNLLVKSKDTCPPNAPTSERLLNLDLQAIRGNQM